MLGRSHVTLAGSAYLALLAHPLETSWGWCLTAPVLRSATGPVPSLPIIVIVSFGTAVLAALAPDFDHAGSAVAQAAGVMSRPLAFGVQRVLRHRGPLHSALAVLVASVLGELLGARFGMAGMGAVVAYGWATHVLADATTGRGVSLLWPLYKRRVLLGFGAGLATGGRGETWAVLAGVFACACWAAIRLPM